METTKVGIREFRDHLSTYLLESDKPIAITRHGDTIGLYIPTRRKRNEAAWAEFREAANRFQESMVAAGVTEEELMEDLDRMHAERRNERLKAAGA
jgi:antitoxin (DNA-binding transcriptional repressor) of toxin-antitoxin stability system